MDGFYSENWYWFKRSIFRVLLSLSGYKSSTNCLSSLVDLDQPLTAIITIRLCMGLIPSLLILAGLITMKPWRSLDFKFQRVVGQ